MASSPSSTSSHVDNLGKRSPQAVVSKLLFSHWITPAICVVVKNGIPDLLAGGPQSAAALAASTGMHADSLGRVMRALVSIGVFKSQPDGTYALTELSDVLRSNVEGSMRPFTLWINHPIRPAAWGVLEDAVRHGTNPFQQVHGDYFSEYVAKNPEAMSKFQDAMTSNTINFFRAVVDSFSFSGVNTLIDVGGGHGALLAAILAKYPTMHGILFDLPNVVTDVVPLQKNSDVQARCRVEGGNFFTSSIPLGADAAIMSFIIHNWGDTQAIVILEKVRAALPINGRLFVCEHVVIEDDFEPWLDLEMLVICHGGRERSEDEYRALFIATGFELVAVHRTASVISVVEGRAC